MLVRMRTLLVLRHAKSDRGDPGVRDHERPLAPRGRRAAPRVGEWLRAQGLVPDVVRCSSARRAQETLALVAEPLGDVDVEVDGSLYGAGTDGLVAAVRRLPDAAGSVLLVGHNPGFQELVLRLVDRGAARDRVRAKFPTAALAVIALPVERWADVAEGEGDLVAFVTPAELEGA